MEEAEKCDRVAILHEGNLVSLGTPAELKAQIGGDVISVETEHPEVLAREIEQKFKVAARVVDGALPGSSRPRATKLSLSLIAAFPTQVRSVTLGKPTLEDVFIKQTGHRFWKISDE